MHCHSALHLLERLNVPDEVLQCVQALLYRERELMVDCAQEVCHLFNTTQAHHINSCLATLGAHARMLVYCKR